MDKPADLTKVSRNYKEEPLKKYVEKPCKEDMEYVYIECNYTKKEAADFFGICIGSLERYLKSYEIKKSREAITRNTVKTGKERFGPKGPLGNKEVREKSKATWIKNLGVDNPMKNKDIQGKAGDTNMERLGVRYPLQNEEVFAKVKATQKKHTGKEFYSQTEEYRQRRRATQGEVDKP